MMWRRLSRLRTSLDRKRGRLEGCYFSHAAHTCSVPTLPTGRITAFEAMVLWKRYFEEAGVAEPDLSSQYILAHLLGAKTVFDLQQEKLSEFLSHDRAELMWELCTKRLSRMPVQYVIEEWDFRDLTLKMRPPVFIPRPETEELVELVLTDLQVMLGESEAQPTSLEIGCGSGAISLSLLKSVPQLRAIALDQSHDAVVLTRENALRLGLQDRLQIHHIDVIKDADMVVKLCGSVSTLVSNPPYLLSEDMISLEPEIIRFEDHAALDGGRDGLRVIRHILSLAAKILSHSGRVYLEVDPRHPPLIQQWVHKHVNQLQYTETRLDISGRPRFCIFQR